MDGYFTHLGDKNITFHPDDITDIEQSFKNSIIERLIFTRADVIAFKI